MFLKIMIKKYMIPLILGTLCAAGFTTGASSKGQDAILPNGVTLVGELKQGDDIIQLLPNGEGKAVLSKRITLNGQVCFIKAELINKSGNDFDFLFHYPWQNRPLMDKWISQILENLLNKVKNLKITVKAVQTTPVPTPKQPTGMDLFSLCSVCAATVDKEEIEIKEIKDVQIDMARLVESFKSNFETIRDLKLLARGLDEVRKDVEKNNKAAQNAKNNFSEEWERLKMPAVQDNPLGVDPKPFGLFMSKGTNITPFDYFAFYLFQEGLKVFQTYEDAKNLIPPDTNGQDWLTGLGYSEIDWGSLQGVLTGLLRIAVDPARARIQASNGAGDGFVKYLLYITTEENFTFSDKTTVNRTWKKWLEEYGSVLGFVELDPKSKINWATRGLGNQVAQRGMNSTINNLFREIRVPVGITLTKFAALIGNFMNPKATRLYIHALAPMAHLIDKNFPDTYYEVEDSLNLSKIKKYDTDLQYYPCGMADTLFALDINKLVTDSQQEKPGAPDPDPS